MRVCELGILESRTQVELPLVSTRIPCGTGFPSPADDYIEERLDLNKYLIEHPEATYFARAEGDSMIGAGIFHEDFLIVDKTYNDRPNGRVVIAWLNGDFTVKRFYLDKRLKRSFLIAENPKYPPLEILPEMEFVIWGVVTWNFHKQSTALDDDIKQQVISIGSRR